MPRKAPSTTHKRSRASKPKVTTGCLTCKVRRIKCDESKPHCNRCLRTGRTCDGYSSPLPRPTAITSCPTSTIAHLPSLSAVLISLPGTPSERLSFHFFLSHTAPQLRGLFESPFWSQHVLQACLREEAIWHAAVALGAAHGRLYAEKSRGGEGQRWEGEGFAIKQYVKAISCLTRRGSGERRIDVALMACVLFTCFESLRGHHAPALVHLDNGVNLLLELQSHEKQGHLITQTYPPTPYTPLSALQALLTRLDTQATQLLPSRHTRLHPVSTPPTHYETFTSLEEAQRASDELWNYCLYTLQPSYSSPYLHPQPQPSHDDLTHRQASYATALTTYLTTHPPRTAREQQAGHMLRLHTLVATLSLSTTSLPPSEDVWDTHTPSFAAIVDLARRIIDLDTDVDIYAPETGVVGLDTGVLGPLYLTALRCRDPMVRREAVELLKKERRREGLWDSTLLATVAERVVRIEEGDSKSEMDMGRISDVDVVFDPEGCRVGVRFMLEGARGSVEGHRELVVATDLQRGWNTY
ncbi:hypothetical protein O988_03082 [Pseudogymnoascus sp. VKM F-3808]|nr:hypothetical protein O988_03082 [Pseudogymnoascus sp. VKM F-3808]